MKAGLLVNPRAGKLSGKGLKLMEALGSQTVVSHTILNDFSQLEPALRQFAAEGVTTLAISSGDGTIQAIQTLLAETNIFAQRPRLMLLPHGTTNMTAADLGVTTRNLKKLAAILQSTPALAGAETRIRPTLRIVNPADGRPRHGMFTGTGAIWRAVQFCQQAVHGAGLRGDAATFTTLALAIGGLFFNGRTPQSERIGRVWDFKARAEGSSIGSGDQLLFMATTLEKLVLGSRPFWGGKTAPIRATVLPFPMPQVWRWIIPTLYGSETRAVMPGAVSLCAQDFEIDTRVSWIVDGEFYDAPENEPLRITRGADFTYVIV
jgi:diacylglycerol kinase (ATP)